MSFSGILSFMESTAQETLAKGYSEGDLCFSLQVCFIFFFRTLETSFEIQQKMNRKQFFRCSLKSLVHFLLSIFFTFLVLVHSPE